MFHILVPIDGSQNAMIALSHAIGMARRRGETCLHLVNVQPGMNRHAGRFVSRKTLAEVHAAAGRERLHEAERRVRESGVEYRSAVLSGQPAQTAVEYANQQGIHQMVVGTARKSTWHRLLTGSFANDLVRLANVPVAVVAGRRPTLFERFGVPAGVGLGLTTLFLID